MITSLHSPHVEAVKALLGSRGGKARKESGQYVIEGFSSIKEALDFSPEEITTLYLTSDGMSRLATIPEGYFKFSGRESKKRQRPICNLKFLIN